MYNLADEKAIIAKIESREYLDFDDIIVPEDAPPIELIYEKYFIFIKTYIKYNPELTKNIIKWVYIHTNLKNIIPSETGLTWSGKCPAYILNDPPEFMSGYGDMEVMEYPSLKNKIP